MEYTDTTYLRVYGMFSYTIKKLARDCENYPYEVNSRVLLGEDWVYTIVYNMEHVKPTRRKISSKPSRQGSRR